MSADQPQAPAALWFDGKSARAFPATVVLADDALCLYRQGADPLHFPLASLSWLGGPRAARPILQTPGGGQLLFPSRQASLELGLPVPPEPALRRLLATTPALLIALLAWLTLLAALLVWALPRAADFAAERLPRKAEERLALETLRAFDAAYTKPSELSDAERARIKERVNELGRAAGLTELRVEFRQAPRIGPNAMALPGSRVILTDELIAALGASPLLDAILAHELGHIHARHGIRNYLRNAGIGALFLIVLPDPTMAEKSAQGFAQRVIMSGHSREAEREADEFARKLLAKLGRPSGDLAEALRMLSAKAGTETAGAGFLSSHPSLKERVEAIQ